MTPNTPPKLESREDVVRQDLQSVVHPTVPHKLLEEHSSLCGTKDSTIVDADGIEHVEARLSDELGDRARARPAIDPLAAVARRMPSMTAPSE